MTRRTVCPVCGEPLPVGSGRGRPRLTCSVACRRAVSRNAAPLSGVTPAVSAPPTPPRAAPVEFREPTPPPRLPLPIEVRHVPGEWLSNGYPSGIGGRTTYHVGGRSFDTPREALDYAGR